MMIFKKILSSIEHEKLDKYIVPLLPGKYANLLQCSEIDLWNPYFNNAEASMQVQWDKYIWPLIKDFDFTTVLELAPGAGRNTEMLCYVSKKIYAVDYNSYALEQCRKKLGRSYQGCSIEYYVNNGSDLRMIQNDTIASIYCWDAAVHIDKSIMECYIKEFSRVLKHDGQGFIHHSNLGDKADKNIKKNPHWRSNIDKESFAAMCEANKLDITAQIDIPWDKEIVDCCSIFKK